MTKEKREQEPESEGPRVPVSEDRELLFECRTCGEPVLLTAYAPEAVCSGCGHKYARARMTVKAPLPRSDSAKAFAGCRVQMLGPLPPLPPPVVSFNEVFRNADGLTPEAVMRMSLAGKREPLPPPDLPPPTPEGAMYRKADTGDIWEVCCGEWRLRAPGAKTLQARIDAARARIADLRRADCLDLDEEWDLLDAILAGDDWRLQRHERRVNPVPDSEPKEREPR